MIGLFLKKHCRADHMHHDSRPRSFTVKLSREHTLYTEHILLSSLTEITHNQTLPHGCRQTTHAANTTFASDEEGTGGMNMLRFLQDYEVARADALEQMYAMASGIMT
jgi:hypothetical protein